MKKFISALSVSFLLLSGVGGLSSIEASASVKQAASSKIDQKKAQPYINDTISPAAYNIAIELFEDSSYYFGEPMEEYFEGKGSYEDVQLWAKEYLKVHKYNIELLSDLKTKLFMTKAQNNEVLTMKREFKASADSMKALAELILATPESKFDKTFSYKLLKPVRHSKNGTFAVYRLVNK